MVKSTLEVEEEDEKDTGFLACSPLVPLWALYRMGRNRDLQLNLRHQSVGELDRSSALPPLAAHSDVVVHRAGMRSVTQEDADR